MTITIINMTPHDVVIVNKDGHVLRTYPSAGQIRLSSKTVIVADIDGIPLSRTEYGSTELPEYRDGTYYIVSQLVKSAYPDRKDLLIPAELVRDEKGVIIGAMSLGI